MARGSHSAPYGKAPQQPPGLLGRLFLLLCVPLPEALSVHSLVRSVATCFKGAGWFFAALLTFTAPLSIPLLVWTALGADSKQPVVRLPQGLPAIGRLDISGREVSLPALSAPAAFALLAAVSISIHVAQAARQRARQRQQAASARALRPDIALQRPPAAPPKLSTAARRSTPGGAGPMESPFSLHRRQTGLSAPDMKGQFNAGPANGESGGGRGIAVQPLFAQLAEVQRVVFGAEAAAQLAAGIPQTFENAVFETGHLCGIVGVDAPQGGGGSADALNKVLAQLKAAVI